jgi:transcriptional regulator with XRE-family HTH domain
MVDLRHIQIDAGKLKQARQQARGGKGYTQAEAGAAVGVHKAAISKIENGLGLPSADVLARLCALYEIEISALVAEGQIEPAAQVA